MLRYFITDKDQLPYHLAVKVQFQSTSSACRLKIPFWRPGRYSPGEFPANFIDIEVRVDDKIVNSKKTDPFTIEFPAASGRVEVNYRVYARGLSAGNTYSCDDFTLINPVNSLVYVEGMEEESAHISLDLDSHESIATQLEKIGENLYRAENMQEIMDSPFLCAEWLDHFHYQVDEVDFNIHVYGKIAFDHEELIGSFRAFTEEQIREFAGFPVKEYHFLLAILPYETYHGVEHERSTVIIIGPDESLKDRSAFRNLLGVSSHELYHTWNVKYLRPKEWTPYDFTGPGYSRMGYVAEGVTTYMGDLMLWKSRVFSDREFLDELSNLYKRHRFNEGRLHASLADSSIDTWVDGYVRGMPRRKLSIYTEGAWLAFICDVFLLEKTEGESSLSNVMRYLYQNVDPHKGFVENEFWNALSETVDFTWQLIKQDLVDGAGNWDRWLSEAFSLAGLSIEKVDSNDPVLKNFGFTLKKMNGVYKCMYLFEGSPAERAGLWFHDEVIEVNGQKPEEVKIEGLAEMSLKIVSDQSEKLLKLRTNGTKYGQSFRFNWRGDDSLFRSRYLNSERNS